jgi:hypothetical protein
MAPAPSQMHHAPPGLLDAQVPHMVGPVMPPRSVGGASLERDEEAQHHCERDGEQQYEKANRPQQERELPSMGAAVAECGRSLSA